MSESLPRLLIFGCGFLGRRASVLWQQQGGLVSAVTRSEAKASQLAALGIEPIMADLMRPETLTELPATTHLLYCVGYDRQSPWPKEALYIQGLKHVLDAMQTHPVHRCVYVSSSSVYGQDDGSWVDEQSPTEPTSEGGRICLTAEQRLHERWPQATILRMSGLYGSDRLLTRIESLKAGELIGGPPDAWLNLIHGDDAARACVAALRAPAPGPLYLVSDDHPFPRREYFAALARKVGAAPPRFSGEPTSRHSTEGHNKRCRNDRVKRELQLQWLYPNITAGLAADAV